MNNQHTVLKQITIILDRLKSDLERVKQLLIENFEKPDQERFFDDSLDS